MVFLMVFIASPNFYAECSSAVKHQEKAQAWAWIGGSKIGNQHSTVDGKGSCPGARSGTTSWFHSDSTVWVFGGKGFGLKKSRSSQLPTLDELWSFDVKGRHWKFHPFDNKTSKGQKPLPCSGCVSCSYQSKALVFGSPGSYIFDMETMTWTALQDNKSSPVPRSDATHWCDAEKGVLWIFGGKESGKNLDDFWSFSFKHSQWKEMRPKSNESMIPAKCVKAATWMHPSGILYMFGGSCLGQLTSYFWSYSPGMLEWKKLGGSKGVQKCAGKFGQRGVASKDNYPGCRDGAASWIDEHGNLWMFGGSGYDNFSVSAFAMPGLLSDFWMYNVSSHQWMWMGGLSRNEGRPFFGEKGVADAHNIPGPRENALSFSYNNEMWLFGGAGHDVRQYDGMLNDLWMYTTVTTITPTQLPGDTISISFGVRVLIALLVMALGLVVSLSMCYSKECKVFRFKRHLRPVVKYTPVKVETVQVLQPETAGPLNIDPNRNL